MSSPTIKKTPRDVAVLRAFDEDGGQVCVVVVPFDDYFEYPLALLRSDECRVNSKIRRIEGRLYGADGRLLQEFQREYDAHGAQTGGAVRQASGATERPTSSLRGLLCDPDLD